MADLRNVVLLYLWQNRREMKGEDLEKIQAKKSLSAAEPRVAFQMRSDTDIINDGYKWRKYGQKPVKNSRHPRFESLPTFLSIAISLVF